ncbi:MAG: acetate kinase [Desulfobacteraceae bacterium]|nr:acetate kinase [Desulfobacteraceae bacterium]
MNVLVINAGSSSLKYQLLNMEDESVMATGLVERIGEATGKKIYKKFPDTDAEAKVEREEEVPDHRAAMHFVVDMIKDAEYGVIKSMDEVSAIGHRVVQGGDHFKNSVLVDASVKEIIEQISPLAPLHNPSAITGVEMAEELLPNVPNVAVFDTVFHQTMPERAFLYAIPHSLYEDLKVRRYGAHGTSHKYVAKQVAILMDKKPEDVNVITVHLGNGCSMAAVKNGKCVDTSMGMTPLAGLMMGTRSGDIDPAVLAYLAEHKNMTIEEIDNMLNKESGLKGICGLNDMRDIHAKSEQGDEACKLALEMFSYRIRKYLGAYAVVLGSLDAVVFTAGIGENDDIVRSMILKDLDCLGIELDGEKNKGRISEAKVVSTDASRVKAWVIPTNEELQIARETVAVLK